MNVRKIVGKFIIITLAILKLDVNAVQIVVDAQVGRKPISPGIYGQNNTDIFNSDGKTVSAEKCQRIKEAGVRLFRLNGGNNCTKYNWRRKLTSHPDWYNNVYECDWDHKVSSFLKNTVGTQVFMGFQLLGWAAATNKYNFNDWEYNRSQWWCGVTQNLAGGGEPDPTCSGKEKKGDPQLYLMEWPPESTTAILDHWFGEGGLGFDKNRCLYWNMDNEPECWVATHDDVTPPDISYEDYLQRYFKVAKLARQKFPEIKLMGPVPCNEWFWYTWNSKVITDGQKNYCWLEYFIKRVAEEQKNCGMRLLDIIDVHFYPSKDDPDLSLQLHRIWFDTTWVYRDCNGTRFLYSNLVDSVKKEYIFERCRRWCEQYLGPNNGVTFSCSEHGLVSDDPNINAVWYASVLGTFADEGVEVFTPWDWSPSQWEVLHLFSRYGGSIRVQSKSDMDSVVSAYSSINSTEDTLTIILVNRSRKAVHQANIEVKNFIPEGNTFTTLQLKNLPNSETFKSHTSNALIKGSVEFNNGKLSIELPMLSITAVILTKKVLGIKDIYSNISSVNDNIFLKGSVLYINSSAIKIPSILSLYDIQGRCIRKWYIQSKENRVFSLCGLKEGYYVLEINKKLVAKRIFWNSMGEK